MINSMIVARCNFKILNGRKLATSRVVKIVNHAHMVLETFKNVH